MLKLVVKTARIVDTSQGASSILAELDANNKAQHFLVSHSNIRSDLADIFGNLNEQAEIPMGDLVRLLLMHPAFRYTQSILDFIYADMLDLIGLDYVSVKAISDNFAHSDIMIITVVNTLNRQENKYNNVQTTGSFEFKLHNNCRSLIRKAMINLIHVRATKWERQVAR